MPKSEPTILFFLLRKINASNQASHQLANNEMAKTQNRRRELSLVWRSYLSHLPPKHSSPQKRRAFFLTLFTLSVSRELSLFFLDCSLFLAFKLFIGLCNGGKAIEIESFLAGISAPTLIKVSGDKLLLHFQNQDEPFYINASKLCKTHSICTNICVFQWV